MRQFLRKERQSRVRHAGIDMEESHESANSLADGCRRRKTLEGTMSFSRFLLVVAVSVSFSIPAAASSAEEGEYVIAERGQHHQVWRKLTPQTNELGEIAYRTNSFTQLATGLNRQQNGRWIESAPEIVIDGNRALAHGAAHEAIFAGNVNSPNAIQVKTPEGAWLKGRIYGIAYHDVAAGTNVLIGELKDSAGQLVGTNKVRYPDAFTGIEGVDVEYTYRKSGISQCIVFRGASPPGPEEYGLNPERTDLLVLTEFTEFPNPTVKKREWNAETERVEDETISFGASMRMGCGQAFEIKHGVPGKRRTDVTKSWQILSARNFVVERVRYRQVKSELKLLPAHDSSSVTNGTASVKRKARWFAEGTLPLTEGFAANAPSNLAPPDNGAGELQFAILESSSPESELYSGFVLDWEMVYSGWLQYFFCGYTYVIFDEVHLSEAYFEPGSVVKFQPYEYGYRYNSLWVDGPLSWGGGQCAGTAYALLTSVNDDANGEPIYGYSTGSPQWGDYGPALVVRPQDLASAQANIQCYYGNPGIIASGPGLSTVTVTASDVVATKGADSAKFTIARADGDWSQSLTVHFSLGGTATTPADYAPVSLSVPILPNEEDADVTITPTSQGGTIYDSTVTLTITPNSSYIVGTPQTATVTIYDPSVPPPPGAPAPTGLVAWWRGENNALDSVASYHGTIYGSVGFNYGKVAQGFEFHSVLSERVKVTDSAALNFGANADFSIEVWIKADQNPPPTAYGVQTIVDKRYTPNDSTATGYALFLLNGTLYCQLGVNGGAANFGSAGPDLRDGQFHHVAVSVDRDSSTGLKLYVDGVLCGNPLNPTGKSGSLANNDYFRIGTHAREALNAPFKGIIDEVSLYNRALVEADIQSIYNTGRGGKCTQGVSITAFETRLMRHLAQEHSG